MNARQKKRRIKERLERSRENQVGEDPNNRSVTGPLVQKIKNQEQPSGDLLLIQQRRWAMHKAERVSRLGDERWKAT